MNRYRWRIAGFVVFWRLPIVLLRRMMRTALAWGVWGIAEQQVRRT